VNRLVAAIFVAHERNDLLVRGLIVERILAAVVGITLLALGAGIVPVSGAYTLGAGAGLVVSIVLVRRRIELPKFRFVRAEAKPLAIKSVPFAADDVLTALLFKLDAVLLAIISTDVAVGLYGAAYRLFESTLSIDYSLAGAFGAMYAYLSHDTEPTIQAVFQRSLKLALVTLVPFAVTFGALAEPIVRLLYGHELIGAAGPLRLLAPAQVMLGLITLSAILIVYRRSPVLSAAATGIAVVLNLALNLILIPHLDENGAALAMLITEAVFMVAAVTLALQNVGRIEVRTTVLGPLVAGGVMSVVMLALESQFLLALILGGLAYLGVLFLVERLSAPQDVRFVTELLRRRLRRRGAVA
jgi:O-antigen/teichoic acid export membrane protein